MIFAQRIIKMRSRVFQFFLVFIAALGLNLSVDASASFLQKDTTSLFASHKFFKLHLPAQPTPSPNNRETPDENDLDEDLDPDFSLLANQQISLGLLNLITVADWTLLPSHFTYNRTSVPLFVLHHCWKSFVA